jgi:outer membrane lipoprotein LolB
MILSLRHTLFLFLLISLLFSGCSTLKPVTYHDRSWETRAAELNQLKDFTAQGVISIHEGKEAEKASFHLVQQGEQYQLSLYGPLGMGRNVIKGDTQGVSLTDSSGKIFTAASPEALLKKETGWSLPLSNLQYWIRGLPAPRQSRVSKWDVYHHLEQLQQQDWQIHYEHYMQVEGYDLPRKIRFERKGLEVILVINKWTLT